MAESFVKFPSTSFKIIFENVYIFNQNAFLLQNVNTICICFLRN